MSERGGLGVEAYEPVPEGESYRPYVSAAESPAEFTLRAALAGIVFGIVFGAANAYLGLLAGLTISTSIPIAVMTVAAFKAFEKMGKKGSILEANLAQTTGSASSSVASGIIFTLPALFLWNRDPDLLQMTLLGLSGGVLGILFMIPLRRFLIAREHGKLPYPEGTACAEVLVASERGGDRAANVFVGLGVGAAFKLLTDWLRLVPGKVSGSIPFLPKGELGCALNPALLGVGYILGPRVASIMVGGGLLSSLVIIPGIYIWGKDLTAPFYPETVKLIADMSPYEIWTRYVRYIGAGAVAVAGFITLVKSIPTMVESFRIGASQLRKGSGDAAEQGPRTDRDLPIMAVLMGAGVIALLLVLMPQAFGTIDSALARVLAAVLVVIFAFFFVTVSSRIVGLVGVTSNPTSGMTIATLIGTSVLFLAFGWTDMDGKVAALCVGCVVAIAASIAGDTSQDLKTGFILGATPKRQQIGELLGVLTSAAFVCGAVLLLDEAYELGSEDLPAPQGTLMKLVIDGVLEQSLPWTLVAIGGGIAIVCELFKLPALAFAVGVYLPVTTMVPVFLGGLLRHLMTRKTSDTVKAQRQEHGVLFGSGLVGGVGLMGVVIAAVAFLTKGKPQGVVDLTTLNPLVVSLIGVAAFAVLIALFADSAKRDG